MRTAEMEAAVRELADARRAVRDARAGLVAAEARLTLARHAANEAMCKAIGDVWDRSGGDVRWSFSLLDGDE